MLAGSDRCYKCHLVELPERYLAGFNAAATQMFRVQGVVVERTPPLIIVTAL